MASKLGRDPYKNSIYNCKNCKLNFENVFWVRL